MADKKLKLPKTDIESAFDIPDFNFEIPEPKDDRKPTTKVKDGIVSGAKSAFQDTNFIRRLLRETLPPEFGELDNIRIETTSGIKKLYNSAVTEVRPSVYEMARAVDRLVPAEKQKIKNALGKVKEWGKDEKYDYSEKDARIQREKNLAIEMGDIFGSLKNQQDEVELEKDSRDQAEQKVRDVLDLNRHKVQVKLLGGIYQSTQSLAQYNSNINIRYQRRSLELQIRSYDLALDTYKAAKESSESIKAELKLIAKNTALPEFVKLRKSEAWKEQVRNRFISEMNNGLFGTRAGLVRDFFGRLSREVKNRASSAASAFGQGAFAADQMADASDTAKEFGVSTPGKEEIGGEVAGSLLSQGAMRKAGKWVGGKLKQNETVNKLAKDIGYGLKTGPQKLVDYAKVDYSDGVIKRTIKDILSMGLGSMRPDTRVMSDSLLNTDPNNVTGLRGYSQFTNQNSKSLDEIIPGYLARIYREIQVLRTGDTSIDLTTYDFTKNQFVDSKVAAQRVIDTLVPQFGKDAFKERVNGIFSEIDPKGKLSDEERRAMAQFLTEQNINNRNLDHNTLARRGTYKGVFTDDKSAARVANLFKSYYGGSTTEDVDTSTMDYKEKRNKLANLITSLGVDFTDPRTLVQELINIGQYDLVEQIGLVDNGKVNLKKVISLYNGSGSSDIQPRLTTGDNYLKNKGPSRTNVINKYNFIQPPQEQIKPDLFNNILEQSKSQHEDLVTILREMKTEDLKAGIDGTNTILERIEKLIKSNLKIVIRREARESKFKTGYGGMNYDFGAMKYGLYPGASNAYSSMKDKLSVGANTPKDAADDKMDDLNDLLDSVDTDSINETTEGFKGMAKEKVERIKEFFRNHLRARNKPDPRYDEDGNEIIDEKDLRTVIGSLKNAYRKSIGKIVKPTLAVGGGLLRAIKPGFKLGINTARVAGRVGLNTTRNVVDRLVDIRDVYVEGEDSPRLLAVKLRKGLYFDGETGESIKRLHQIKGDIKDENGEIVLYKEEIPKSYTRTSKGGIVGLGITLTKAGISIVNTMNRSIIGGGGIVIGLAKKTLIGVRNLFDQPTDIYVKENDGVSEKPILLAVVMRNGGYYSKTTGKVIDRPSLIDGPIVDRDGNLVLTEDHLKKGLVDQKGRSIDGPYAKMAKLGLGLAKGVFNLARNTAGRIAKAMGGSIEMGGELIQGFFDKFNRLLGGGKSYDVLVEIRNLLDKRLPGGAKSPFDKDGDGDRDGSWQDMLQEQKGKEKAGPNVADGDGKAKTNRKNTIDRLIDGAKGLLGFGGDSDVDADVDVDGPDGKKKKPGGKAKTGGKGLLGRGLGLGSGLARLALPAAAGAGAVYMGSKAIDDVKGGNYGDAALHGALGGAAAYATSASIFGFGATNAALATAGGGIASLAGGAGSVMAGLLSNPVGWAILGTAVVGYGAYKLYKYLSSPNMKPLSRVRMAQYGFGTGEEDYIKKIQAFEKYLTPFVKYDAEGVASLTVGEKEAEGINDFFGFDKDDRGMWARFGEWMQGRFKPVFLNTLSVLKSMGVQKGLSEVDELDPEEKLKFLAKAKMPGGPYHLLVSPFPELEKLGVGKRLVDYVVAEAEKAFKEEAKTSPNKKKMTIEGATTTGVVATALTGDDARSKLGIDDNTVSDKDTQVKDYSKLARMNQFIKETTANIMNSNPVTKTALATMTMTSDKVGKFFGFRVDADEAVRFKTYGLIEMDSSKVVSLRNLENLLKDKISFKASGEATWDGIINEFLSDASYHFSIPDKTGPKAQAFVKWFTERFMPVYLNYRSWLKQATNQVGQTEAERVLKSQDRYDIASKVAASQVWDKLTSPWDGYKLSTDPRSTKDNLVFLRDAAKDSKLVETKKTEQLTRDISNAVNKPEVKPSDEVGKNLDKTKYTARDTIKSDLDKQKASIEASNDGENPPSSTPSTQAGGGTTGSTSVGNLKTADGKMSDGSGGDAHIAFKDSSVRLNGMHPSMLKLFKAMAQEYGERTGKKILVTSGFRSTSEQEALYKKDPKKAAAPGKSLHEFGLAVDISPETANELDKLGLMRKYGFTRPVGQEPWHVEMAGIQSDIQKAKSDPEFAKSGIEASPGRGGGGWGTKTGVGKYSRNPNMAKKIFDSGDTSSNIAQQDAAGNPISQINGDQSARAEDQIQGEKKAQSLEGLLMNRNKKVSGPPGTPAQPGTSGVSTPAGDAVQNNMDAKVGDAEGFKKVALPSKGKGYESVKDTIKDAANLVGVDEKFMVTKAAMESSFNPEARASKGSATGLFQFTNDTWNEMLQKHGKKYGIPPGTPPTDARANAILAAQYVKDNEGKLKEVTGGEVTNRDRYLAHFLGPTGAEKILKAGDTELAADIRPDAAANPVNRNMFYHKDGRPKTVAEFKAGVDNKLDTTLAKHGVDDALFAKNTPKQSAPTNQDPNIVRASFVPPTVIPSAEAPTTPVRMSDYNKRNEIATAMKPPPVATAIQSRPLYEQQSAAKTDNNMLVTTMTKVANETLEIQKNQLSELQAIVKLLDHAKLGEMFANAMKNVVPQNQNTQASPDDDSTYRRNGIIKQTKPPVSVGRMT